MVLKLEVKQKLLLLNAYSVLKKIRKFWVIFSLEDLQSLILVLCDKAANLGKVSRDANNQKR